MWYWRTEFPWRRINCFLKRRPRRDMINQALEAIRKRQFPFLILIWFTESKDKLWPAFFIHWNRLFCFSLTNSLSIRYMCDREPAITGGNLMMSVSGCIVPPVICWKTEAFYKLRCGVLFIIRLLDAEISCGDEVMLSCGSGGRSYLGHFALCHPVYCFSTLHCRRDRWLCGHCWFYSGS